MSSQPSGPKCRCLVRHAITADERAEASEKRAEAIACRDTVGIILSAAALSHCPAVARAEAVSDG
jgi:hypothetical protein